MLFRSVFVVKPWNISRVSLGYSNNFQNAFKQFNRFESTLPPNWAQNFRKTMIPYKTFETSFNRSSGPGGQNVNKVATKVEMRFLLDDANWLPEYVRQKIVEQNRNRINKKGEFVVTSDRTRSQVKNSDDCVDKIYQIILMAGEVPKEPDQETIDRVKKLQKIEKEKKKESKQFQAKKKSSRKFKGDF
ncbi:hypothetical protein K7432_003903 [Basidiobolus ranarum]|uniref:Prokaryotic-type class I peptide chain release factors domain-containing protein n=1 Tax=Basidiobolus ranarum TaxID=34480 RepID=A0ABR2W5H4_9FUNG